VTQADIVKQERLVGANANCTSNGSQTELTKVGRRTYSNLDQDGASITAAKTPWV
jgi:hypothetical protein